MSENECHFVTELKIAVGKSHKSIQISQILTNRFKDFLPLGAPLPFQGRGRGGAILSEFPRRRWRWRWLRSGFLPCVGRQDREG